MSERADPAPPRVLLRLVGIGLAFALTILAAWMIALGHSQREVSLGVIAGLWAALVAAFTLFGGHRHANALGLGEAASGHELELRQNHALELQRETAARRAYEQHLHEMVRREIGHIQHSMSEQLHQLRDDVSGLRGDLVEKVGGQIRLERIETTRVIGSDIEALQNEVRRLAARPAALPSGFSAAAAPVSTAPVNGAPPLGEDRIDNGYDVFAPSQRPGQSYPLPPIARATAPWERPSPTSPEVLPSDPPPTALTPLDLSPLDGPRPVLTPLDFSPLDGPRPVLTPLDFSPVEAEAPPSPRPAVAVPPTVVAPMSVAASGPTPVPTSVSTPVPTSVASPQLLGSDPFAGLPRLTPFAEAEGAGPDSGTVNGTAHSDGPGRAETQDTAGEAALSGGRRRRVDGDPNDILARLLESS